jgi:pyrroline-5-carboxylate reductase
MAVVIDRETVEKTLSNGTFVATVRTVGTGDPVVQLTRVGTPGGTAIQSLRDLAKDATEMADALESAVAEVVAKRMVRGD